jgi:hypothetical protein
MLPAYIHNWLPVKHWWDHRTTCSCGHHTQIYNSYRGSLWLLKHILLAIHTRTLTILHALPACNIGDRAADDQHAGRVWQLQFLRTQVRNILLVHQLKERRPAGSLQFVRNNPLFAFASPAGIRPSIHSWMKAAIWCTSLDTCVTWTRPYVLRPAGWG